MEDMVSKGKHTILKSDAYNGQTANEKEGEEELGNPSENSNKHFLLQYRYSNLS